MARICRDMFNPDGDAIGTILIGVTDGSYYNGPSKCLLIAVSVFYQDISIYQSKHYSVSQDSVP